MGPGNCRSLKLMHGYNPSWVHSMTACMAVFATIACAHPAIITAGETVEIELLPPQLKLLRIEAEDINLSKAVCWAR